MKTTNKVYAITLGLTCSLAVTLKAQNIYVANVGNDPGAGGTVGEYTLNGSTVNASLISGFRDYGPYGMAFSGNDLFIVNGTTVSEYTTSGATINASLFSQFDLLRGGIAISGNNMFISDNAESSIDEYTASGAAIRVPLVTGTENPGDLVISGDDLFVGGTSFSGLGTVGEYTTSGNTVNASLITEPGSTGGIAISGNDLFVANYTYGTIGEYTTSGMTVNASLITGLNEPWGMAVFGNDLYVADTGSGTVGEYTLSGATVNATLISGLNYPVGIAFGPVPEPSTVALTGLGAAALWLRRRRKYFGLYKSLRPLVNIFGIQV